MRYIYIYIYNPECGICLLSLSLTRIQFISPPLGNPSQYSHLKSELS